MELTVTTRIISGVVILDMVGRLWILDLPLRDLIRKMLDDGHRFFVLNLTDLSYIDSSGLGQMIMIWTSINNRNGHMTLLRPTARVQKLLEMTKLHRVFEIFRDENEAVIEAAKGRGAVFEIGA